MAKKELVKKNDPKIDLIDVEVLIPYARNSRLHSERQIDQIAASIKEFGFLNPVIIDKDNGIIAGHGRISAAKKLGIKQIPCIKAEHLTEAQKRAYIIADNRLAELASWDNEMLKVELEDLILDNFNLDLIGIDDEYLKSINLSFENIMKNSDFNEIEEDSIPEIEKNKHNVKYGDIFLLGRHKVICGDSTDESILLKLFEKQKCELLITDPPYNVAYEGKTKDKLKISNDSMEDGNFLEFLKAAFKSAASVMNNGSSFYIWHADSEGLNFRMACNNELGKVRQCLIWNKNTLVMGRQDYHWKHEPCLYGWKDGDSHNWYSDRKQTTVLDFNKPSRNGEHPTMKPVELIEYQIKNSSKKDDIVLDIFLGSGTTLIASEKTGRICYGVELDPHYVSVILERYKLVTGNDFIKL